MSGLLEGKKVLVTGVLDRRSIAYSAARLAAEQGAEVVLSSFGRARSLTEVGKTRQETNGGGSAGERIGVVLVEENPEEETGCQKDSVTVTKATKLLERRGGDLTRIGFDDLKAGQRVRAWYTGPVAESYPRQATASLIVVYLPAE